MSTVTWTITDAAEGVDLAEWSAGPDDVAGMPGGWSVGARRLVGGRRAGVSVVEVDNGALRFAVLPTRGMGVWRAWQGDRVLGWQSPVRGPVHPQFVPLSEPGGLGWLEGFDELIARCGLLSNGAPEFAPDGTLARPLHGRIANLPAHRVTVAADGKTGTISVTGEVDETRFLFHDLRLTSTISTRIGEAAFHVRDEVRNLSARDAEFQMLYHINVGPPLLEAGASLVVPAKSVVPRDERAAEGVSSWPVYADEEPGFAEQVYFFELLGDAGGETRALLKNSAETEGVGLSFDLRQLPWFTQWKNTAAAEDGYVTGLEPATNLPNPRSFEGRQGRVVTLAPGESYGMGFSLRWLSGAEAVSAAEAEIRALQAGTQPQVFPSPQPGWCAGA